MSLKTSSGQSTIAAAAYSQQGGRLINLPIAAGATVRANSRGTQAYLVVATASVNMRPLGGDFVQYSVGTGINTVQPFNDVEIENFNAFGVVISLWCGFDSFIDNRLIIANASNPIIPFPTYGVPESANFINIVDLTGGAFSDINGTVWLALYRVAILIFNLDAGDTYQLYGYSPAGTAGSSAVAAIPPAPLPLRLDMSGNYTINTGGSPVNMIVSELYSVIPAQ